MFNKKHKFDVEVYLLKSVDDFGKMSYADDKELSGYIQNSDFLPRMGDVIIHNKFHYKVDRIIINYEKKTLNILLSESRFDVKIQK
jgi:hypothetical protein